MSGSSAALSKAVRKGDLDAVLGLLERMFGGELPPEDFSEAAAASDLQTHQQAALARLATAGAFTAPLNKSSDTLLHLLGRADETAVLTTALLPFVAPGDTDPRNKVGHTPLHEAALAGNPQVCAAFLAAGAAVDALKHADWTPLHLAAGKLDAGPTVAILLTNGASPHLVNKDGWTAFHLACKGGDERAVRALLAADSQAWRTASKNGRTPLMTAALHGRLAIAALLLECAVQAGAADLAALLNRQDSCGLSAVFSAVMGGHPDMTRLLLDRGADVTLRDTCERTLLHIAAQTSDGKEYFETTSTNARANFNLLFAQPACRQQISAIDRTGFTPLHLAAAEGNQLAVELLLGAGADAYAADSRGRTPLDLARQAGKQAVVPLLEATPAPPSAPLCP